MVGKADRGASRVRPAQAVVERVGAGRRAVVGKCCKTFGKVFVECRVLGSC